MKVVPLDEGPNEDAPPAPPAEGRARVEAEPSATHPGPPVHARASVPPRPTQPPRAEASHRAKAPQDRGFLPILLVLSPTVIGVAMVVTAVAYLMPANHVAESSPGHVDQVGWLHLWERWSQELAPAIGLTAAALYGLVLALVLRNFATPDRVNPRLYGELFDRWSTLDARVQDLCPVPGADATSWGAAARTACSEARRHRDVMAQELVSTGARWVLGYGFVDLWVRLHGAEEALLIVQPAEQVVAQALFDEMRLKDSKVDNSEDFLSKLRWAVGALGGAKYLTPTPPPGPAGPDDQTEQDQVQARMVLRHVRHAVNNFRDERRHALVAARNHLISTGLVTALLAYALLALAVVAGAPPTAIVAGVAFFLVGAVVGLFNQLRLSWQSGSSNEEDFGLARAQLLLAPVVSGLAAVGGVLITAMLYATLNGPIVTYSEGTAATAPGLDVPPLWRIFDLHENRFGLVLASVFGLTPGLLTDRLRSEASQYKDDLRSTSEQERDKR